VRDIPELAPHVPASNLVEASDERSLAGGGIAECLARSAAARATGLWVCRRGAVRKEVYLIDGAPEFVSSNLASELLGEFLVAGNVLNRGELDMALAVLPRFDGRLGDTLAALGLIEPVELFQHIAAQIREKLLELFTWEEGVATFHDGVPVPQRYFPLGLDPWQVIGEGIDRRLRAHVDAERDPSATSRVPMASGAIVPDGAPRDLEMLVRLARAGRSLGDVLLALTDPTGRDAQRPERVLRLGLALGLISLEA
jgi:serine/threonine-protein kinase